MIKKLTLVLVIVMLFTTISGCSGGSASESGAAGSAASSENTVSNANTKSTESEQIDDTANTNTQEGTEGIEVPVLPEEEVTLTFMGGAHLVSVVEVVMRDYLAEHPNTKINFEKYSYAEYPTKMRVQLSTGEDTPDIMVIHDEFATQFANSGWLMDLTPMVPVDDVLPVLDNITVDGKIHGLSNQTSNIYVFMYRKDIYDQFGLTPPSTWDEYYEQGLLLKEEGYYVGAVFPADAIEPFIYYVYMLGGCIYDNGGNVVIDKGVEALEMLKKGLDAGIFHESKQGSSESGKGEYWTAFNEGLLAAFPGRGGEAAYYETNVDPAGKGGYGNIAMAPAMKFSEDGRDTFAYTTSYFVINSKTKNADAAKHVLNYLALSEEACMKFSNLNEEGLMAKYTTGYLPSIRSIVENGSEGWASFGGQEVITEFAKLLLATPPTVPYRDSRSLESDAIIQTIVGETLINNKYTPEEAVAEMIRQIEGL